MGTTWRQSTNPRHPCPMSQNAAGWTPVTPARASRTGFAEVSSVYAVMHRISGHIAVSPAFVPVNKLSVWQAPVAPSRAGSLAHLPVRKRWLQCRRVIQGRLCHVCGLHSWHGSRSPPDLSLGPPDTAARLLCQAVLTHTPYPDTRFMTWSRNACQSRSGCTTCSSGVGVQARRE
jgi:hypothetical protein